MKYSLLVTFLLSVLQASSSHALFQMQLFFKPRTFSLESSQPNTISEIYSANRERTLFFLNRNIIGFEVWLAGSSLNQIESSGGHIILRFLDDNTNHLDDTLVTFIMLPLEANSIYSKAFGGFQLVPMIQSMSEVLITYMKNENRSIHRYIIPANSQRIDLLKRTISQLTSAPNLLGDYHFFTNNCMTGLIKLLKQSGFPVLHGAMADLPMNMNRWLSFNFLNFYPRHDQLNIDGATRVISALQKKHSLSYAEKTINLLIKNNKADSILLNDRFWEDILKLEYSDLNKLALFWPTEWSRFTHKLHQMLSIRNVKLDLSVVNLDIKPLRLELYQSCDKKDDNCQNNKMKSALEYWTPTELKEHLRGNFLRHSYETQRAQQLIGDSRMQILETLKNDLVTELLDYSSKVMSLPPL